MGIHVTRDELFDTIEENVRSVEQGLGKQLSDVERQMQALELRVERNLAASKSKVVEFPGDRVARKDFEKLQEDHDELADTVLSLVRAMKVIQKSLNETYEDLQMVKVDVGLE